eukprot:g3087.t1
MSSLALVSGEELLSALADLWEKNTILVFWMQRVFQYLDRFFTKSSTEHPDLFKAALQCFTDTVYSKVKDKCVAAMVAVVNRERDGYEINQDYMKARGSYKNDFESSLLSATQEYYRNKVAGWMAAYSCPIFLAEIQKRLDDEESRLSRYLDSSSETELKRVVQMELILNTAKQLVEMSTGAQSMFQNQRYEELKLMYRIFKREPTMLPHLISVMEPYIEQRCSRIVEDQQMIDNPPTYTERVLELKKEVDDMVVSCFESDTGFQKGRNKGLEAILNKDTRCAKYLALFSDLQLKKGLKGRNEDEVQSLVNQVVGLFAHLKDKDIFLDIYKSALSRRLLNKLSVSNDAEDCFITKLKVECGQQAIQKLASMFTDMALSDQLQEEYMKGSHSGSPGGVTHEVRVLQTNAWPEKADDAPVVMSLTVSRHKVLMHDGTGKDLSIDAKLQVNSSFTSEKIKVQVSLIKKEEKAGETTALAEAPVERKHVIDAAIVRIMKSRNRLEHNALLEEVFRQCTLFKPQPTQIKSQIEHLIEREFLKRDEKNRNAYIYLP